PVFQVVGSPEGSDSAAGYTTAFLVRGIILGLAALTTLFTPKTTTAEQEAAAQERAAAKSSERVNRGARSGRRGASRPAWRQAPARSFILPRPGTSTHG